MKNKKIILLFGSLLIIIFIVGIFLIKYVTKIKKIEYSEEYIPQEEISEEYIPQEEISEEQYRETIVSIYFIDRDTNMIKPEARLVRVNKLINLPYDTLIELLIEGPKNQKLRSVIPVDTKLLDSSLDGECLTINFSNEFLNYDKNISKENLINSIVNTLTELNEVNKIKILINGDINEEFKEEYIRK